MTSLHWPPAALALSACLYAQSAVADQPDCAPWLDHRVKKLHSTEQIDLCAATAKKALLIVNTASHCGYTGQFAGLEKLHQRFRSRGLVIVGFPSNDFNQEADDAAETARVCYYNYGVTFLMTDKVGVSGRHAHPIFKHLATEQGQPDWNFNKYLVDRDGRVIKRFTSAVRPNDRTLTRALRQVM